MNTKTTKVILVGSILALALATFLWVKAGHSHLCTFICVETGQTFNLSPDDVAIIPAPNPNTSQRTLLPCRTDNNGHLTIDPHYANALTSRLADRNHFIDPQTLEVRNSDAL